MKKIVKIVPTLILSIMLLFTLGIAGGVNATSLTPDDIGTKANATDTRSSLTGVTNVAGNIISIIRNIAVIVAVVIIAVLGIKFMLGSAEERAEYKKSFIPLIVGIVVVVAAVQIATMLFGVAKTS